MSQLWFYWERSFRFQVSGFVALLRSRGYTQQLPRNIVILRNEGTHKEFDKDWGFNLWSFWCVPSFRMTCREQLIFTS